MANEALQWTANSQDQRRPAKSPRLVQSVLVVPSVRGESLDGFALWAARSSPTLSSPPAPSLPPQAPLFTVGDDPRCLYLICNGYLKLTVGRSHDRQMIVRIAGPGSMLGLYAFLSHGSYEVSAESLTDAQLRPVEREQFLSFLRNHKEAQMRAVQSICQEYRFALQNACRTSLAETVAARVACLILELGRQIGEPLTDGGFRFPILLTHEEMASMT